MYHALLQRAKLPINAKICITSFIWQIVYIYRTALSSFFQEQAFVNLVVSQLCGKMAIWCDQKVVNVI